MQDTRTKPSDASSRITSYVGRLPHSAMREARRNFAPAFFQMMLPNVPKGVIHHLKRFVTAVNAEVTWQAYVNQGLIGAEYIIVVRICFPRCGVKIELRSEVDTLGISDQNRLIAWVSGKLVMDATHCTNPSTVALNKTSTVLKEEFETALEKQKAASHRKVAAACVILVTQVRAGKWIESLPSNVAETGNCSNILE